MAGPVRRQAPECLAGAGVGGVVVDVDQLELVAGVRGPHAEVEADRDDGQLDRSAGGNGDAVVVGLVADGDRAEAG